MAADYELTASGMRSDPTAPKRSRGVKRGWAGRCAGGSGYPSLAFSSMMRPASWCGCCGWYRTARQVGKSYLLTELLLWRICQGERFGEPQLVLHTGKDLPICRDVQRPARMWARRQGDGWYAREANGREEVGAPDGIALDHPCQRIGVRLSGVVSAPWMKSGRWRPKWWKMASSRRWPSADHRSSGY